MSALFPAVAGGGILLGLGTGVAALLGWADRAFRVRPDPKLRKVLALLPGANCGGCGFVGCGEYAESLAAGKSPANRCPVGGPALSAALAEALGLESAPSWPLRAVVRCGACDGSRRKTASYVGDAHCATAHLVAGAQDCVHGCLGLGDCADVCPYAALSVVDGAVHVDLTRCTGCGACVKTCPRGLIQLVPFKAAEMPVVACANPERGPDVRAVCSHGCIGCSACTRKHDCFQMQGALARIDYTLYDPQQAAEGLAAAELCCPMAGIRRVSDSTLNPHPEKVL